MRIGFGLGMIVSLVAVVGSTAVAEGHAPVRPLLEGFEYELPEERARALDAAARAELLAIAANPREPLHVRIRAVHVFSVLHDENAGLALEGLLARPKLPVRLQREAILSLGAGQGVRALETLERFSGHEARLVRGAVVEALRSVPGPEAEALLLRRLSIEADASVRFWLERALRERRSR